MALNVFNDDAVARIKKVVRDAENPLRDLTGTPNPASASGDVWLLCKITSPVSWQGGRYNGRIWQIATKQTLITSLNHMSINDLCTLPEGGDPGADNCILWDLNHVGMQGYYHLLPVGSYVYGRRIGIDANNKVIVAIQQTQIPVTVVVTGDETSSTFAGTCVYSGHITHDTRTIDILVKAHPGIPYSYGDNLEALIVNSIGNVSTLQNGEYHGYLAGFTNETPPRPIVSISHMDAAFLANLYVVGGENSTSVGTYPTWIYRAEAVGSGRTLVTAASPHFRFFAGPCNVGLKGLVVQNRSSTQLIMVNESPKITAMTLTIGGTSYGKFLQWNP